MHFHREDSNNCLHPTKTIAFRGNVSIYMLIIVTILATLYQKLCVKCSQVVPDKQKYNKFANLVICCVTILIISLKFTKLGGVSGTLWRVIIGSIICACVTCDRSKKFTGSIPRTPKSEY